MVCSFVVLLVVLLVARSQKFTAKMRNDEYSNSVHDPEHAEGAVGGGIGTNGVVGGGERVVLGRWDDGICAQLSGGC